MRVPLVLAGVVAVVLAIACAKTGATSGRSAPEAACSDAIYTSPANQPPKPVQPIRIGPAVFNSLANLTRQRALDKPSKELPFYTVKSPLTILAGAHRGVTIRLVGAQSNVALLYSSTWLRRLTSWHYLFSQVPRSARLPLCRNAHTHQPLNTQFAGGFLLRKPGCVMIEVQAIGQSKRHRAMVPLGVPHC